jgi:hypothetical protein
MKIQTSTRLIGIFALGALLCGPLSSFAAETSGAKTTTAKDVGRKVDETSQAIKSYTVEQRDEAIKKARAALRDVDRHIGRLERKLDDKWDQTDQAARKKGRATLNALRRQRNEAAEWLGGLEHSSAESWEEVKNGFVKSYETLGESFAKARKEF